MINGIGQNAAANLAQAGSYPRVKFASTAGESSVQPTETLGVTSRKSDAALQVGFGDNTLSSLGAALRTIGGGLESARRSVPTLEQIRAQQLVELAQDRIAVAQRAAAAQPPEPRPENSNEVLQATSAKGKESQTTQIGSQTTETEKSALVSTAGNETYALYSRRSETSQALSASTVTPKLDIKA